MKYVDGFMMAVPKKNLPAYARLARAAGRIWREHGALDYKECAGDDLAVKRGVPFPRQMQIRPDETVVFSYIVFKSRAHRDRVNARVVKDPRVATRCSTAEIPFDAKRMVYGGFTVLAEA